MNRQRMEKILGAVWGTLGLFFIGAAVAVWFTGSHQWRVLGAKVTLSDWWKPWWIGACLLASRGLWTEEPAWIVSRLASLARKASAMAGLDLGRDAFLWLFLGAGISTTAGVLFVLHYFYIFGALGPGLVVAVGAGVLGGWAHFIFYDLSEWALARFLRVASEKRRASVRHGLYILFWAWLVSGPLTGWEARFTEPIVSQAAIAGGIGALAAWIFCPPWQPTGVAGIIRRVAFMVSAAFLLVFALWSSRQESKKDQPEKSVHDRVLLVTIDTVRADHLSCYGYSRRTSPNLDALAKTGVRFTRAFCPMGITDPSHVTMFTGLYPRTHGVEGPYSAGRGDLPSIFEYFKDRGFKTAAISSRLLLDPRQLGVSGFDYVSLPRLANTSAAEAYRRALNWLCKNRDENVFVWVHFFDPHQPYEPHPDSPIRFTSGKPQPLSADKWLNPGESYSPQEVRDLVDLYDEEIAYSDYWLGQLLDRVSKLKPRSERPPLIIALADHGEALGELQERLHYGFGHADLLYNAVAHIPLIISWPGVVRSGETRDDVVEEVDLAPTLAQMVLGVNDYPGQGRSLKPVIEAPAAWATAFLERPSFVAPPMPFLAKKQYVMVKWPYKLFYTIEGGMELYDLTKDFEEKNDLAAKDPDLVKELFPGLEEWLKAIPLSSSSERKLTPREIERLRTLGYIQ